MKKNKEDLNQKLELLRKELNNLIEINNGKVTKEIVEISQKLDLIIVEAMRKKDWENRKSSNIN